MTPRLWLYGGAVALVVLSYSMTYIKGRSDGAQSERARYERAQRDLQDQLAADGEEINQQAAELERLRRLLSNSATEVDNEARNDPDYVRPGIGPDGVQRLRNHWRAR